MSCKNNNTQSTCNCNFNIKTHGLSDLSKISIAGNDRTNLNWSEISVPEMLPIPCEKPDIESLNQVYVSLDLLTAKLIETPFSYTTYNAVVPPALITQITNLITVLTGTVTTSVTAVTTAVTALLTAVNTVVGALPVIPPAVSAAIAAVTAANAAVTAILTNITAATTALTALLASPTLVAQTLCTALTELEALINQLINAINLLLKTVVDLVNALAAAAITIPGLAALLTAITAAITTALTDIQTALNTLIGIIDSLIVQYLVIEPNEEGTCLTGRKLIIEGVLNQKIVYTANVTTQSVHSADYSVPFSAFIIPYANFEESTYTENAQVFLPDGITKTTVNGFPVACGTDIALTPVLCEEFSIQAYIEDIFAYALDSRTVFKNITLFLLAKVSRTC